MLDVKRPGNATWVGKAVVDFNGADPENVTGSIQVDGADGHPFGRVEVAIYNDPPRVKLTIRDATPAHISQAYLTGAGQDAIIELMAHSAENK
jgi:hypothetical protein